MGGHDGRHFVEVVERPGEESLDEVVRQPDVAQLTQSAALEEGAADGRQSVALQAQVAQLVQVIDGRCWHHCFQQPIQTQLMKQISIEFNSVYLTSVMDG